MPFLRSLSLFALVVGNCILNQAFCGSESDELFVLLGADHALLPTHLEPIEHHGSKYTKTYLDTLHDILSFDLSNNGMTRIVSGREKEQARAAAVGGLAAAPDLKALRAIGLSYLIRWKSVKDQIEAQVISVPSGTSRPISPLLLSGELAKDRTKIHQLADCMYATLFGKPGVAQGKILFVLKHRAEAGNTTSEVFVVDYDGHNARRCTNSRSLCATPAWIPARPQGLANGSRLKQRSDAFLYVSYELGQPKLYTFSQRDGASQRITTMRGNQMTPAVSSDASHVAFCSDITGTADLYLVAFEAGVGALGKPRQIFHQKNSATACPAFAPDGKKLAFVSNKDGSPRVYIMDIPPPGVSAKELRPTLISKRCRENTAPSWSPDGKKIAYSSRNSGDRQIWIYDLEGGIERQITNGPGCKESPCWAPDSLHLVFHARVGNSCELFITNTNQHESIQITSGPGDKLFPSWEP